MSDSNFEKSKSPEKLDYTHKSNYTDEELIEEASKTISGLQKDFDPRDQLVLEEETKRLNEIADKLKPIQKDD